jgi:hypothetical protein
VLSAGLEGSGALSRGHRQCWLPVAFATGFGRVLNAMGDPIDLAGPPPRVLADPPQPAAAARSRKRTASRSISAQPGARARS